jgi:hypothetical protein
MIPGSRLSLRISCNHRWRCWGWDQEEEKTHKIPGRFMVQWIALRENLQETPIFNGKIDGFL